MKDIYYPSMKRATDAQKEKLIREINIKNPSDLPEKVVEKKLTLKQINQGIRVASGYSSKSKTLKRDKKFRK